MHAPPARFRRYGILGGTALLAFALAGCGDNAADAPARHAIPTPAGGDPGLPAPAADAGSVTPPPPPPGSGVVSLGGAPPADMPTGAGGDGLPPLEDNPEAGLVELVPVVPVDGDPAAPAMAATGAEASAATPVAVDGGEQAAAVVRAYYAALESGDHGGAYALWSDGGRASGQSPEQFAAGFADTRTMQVRLGGPGAARQAGDSMVVDVPVSVVATRADGSTRRYAGQYTLRRARGSDAWRITDAQLREERL